MVRLVKAPSTQSQSPPPEDPSSTQLLESLALAAAMAPPASATRPSDTQQVPRKCEQCIARSIKCHSSTDPNDTRCVSCIEDHQLCSKTPNIRVEQFGDDHFVWVLRVPGSDHEVMRRHHDDKINASQLLELIGRTGTRERGALRGFGTPLSMNEWTLERKIAKGDEKRTARYYGSYITLEEAKTLSRREWYVDTKKEVMEGERVRIDKSTKKPVEKIGNVYDRVKMLLDFVPPVETEENPLSQEEALDYDDDDKAAASPVDSQSYAAANGKSREISIHSEDSSHASSVHSDLPPPLPTRGSPIDAQHETADSESDKNIDTITGAHPPFKFTMHMPQQEGEPKTIAHGVINIPSTDQQRPPAASTPSQTGEKRKRSASPDVDDIPPRNTSPAAPDDLLTDSRTVLAAQVADLRKNLARAKADARWTKELREQVGSSAPGDFSYAGFSEQHSQAIKIFKELRAEKREVEGRYRDLKIENNKLKLELREEKEKVGKFMDAFNAAATG